MKIAAIIYVSCFNSKIYLTCLPINCSAPLGLKGYSIIYSAQLSYTSSVLNFVLFKATMRKELNGKYIILPSAGPWHFCVCHKLCICLCVI